MAKTETAESVAAKITAALQPVVTFQVSPKQPPLPTPTPMPAPLAKALGINQS